MRPLGRVALPAPTTAREDESVAIPESSTPLSTAHPSTRDAREVARELGTDTETGLTEAEASRRLAEHGPNELRAAARTPLWKRALAQFADPLIILLLVAAGVSVVAWLLEGEEPVPIDAIVIGAIIVLNAIIGLAQEARADRAVAALASLTHAHSTVVRDGRIRSTSSADLVPGDILLLAEGDRVGADARLITTHSLHTMESSLTGESAPVEKDASTLPSLVPLGDRANMVFAGTAVTRGNGRAIVTATGMETETGAIADLLAETKAEATPLQREVSRLGRTLSIIVIAIAIVVMITITLVQGITSPADLITVLLLGVSLAVAAVPEGLPALLSIVLALGVQRMAKRNAIVKNLSSVESLGSASVICTDKTGTLTTNRMRIERVVTASGETDVSATAAFRDLDAADEQSTAAMREAELTLRVGALANDARLIDDDGEVHAEGDPTETAFLLAAHRLDSERPSPRRFGRIGEVPFSSERKMMSTAHREEGGPVYVFSKGAPDVLLARCTEQRVGDETVPLDDEGRRRAMEAVEALSAQAYRTLGVAYRIAPEEVEETEGAAFDESHEQDLVYVGTVGIIDPPRPEAAAAIEEAHRAGIRVIMITGDHPATAARIARDLGLAREGDPVATGVDLENADAVRLRDIVATTSVFARVAPEHKLRIVDALQERGEIVAMTGDGVNDAPALKSADIGVAMGIAGTEVTKEAARMVLTDDNFATIVAAVREGRVIFDNIRKFLRYLLSSNMGEVLTVFFGVVFAGVLGFTQASPEAVVLPLLATQILWTNLVTDSAPALAMGVDPEVDDVMARPPRGPDDRAIDGAMWAIIATTGLTMSIATLLTMDIFLPGGLVPGGADTFETARTAGFTTLVLAALLTAFNARSARASVVKGLFRNRVLWGSFALAVALQVAVVYVPFLQVAFGTTALDPVHWAVCVGLASLVIWVEEVRKAIVRAQVARLDPDGIGVR